MLNQYIADNFPCLYDLFADITQSEEYSERQIISMLAEQRIQSTDHLLQAVLLNGSMSEEVRTRCITEAINAFNEHCYYAELTGFVLGFQKAASLAYECSKN